MEIHNGGSSGVGAEVISGKVFASDYSVSPWSTRDICDNITDEAPPCKPPLGGDRAEQRLEHGSDSDTAASAFHVLARQLIKAHEEEIALIIRENDLLRDDLRRLLPLHQDPAAAVATFSSTFSSPLLGEQHSCKEKSCASRATPGIMKEGVLRIRSVYAQQNVQVERVAPVNSLEVPLDPAAAKQTAFKSLVTARIMEDDFFQEQMRFLRREIHGCVSPDPSQQPIENAFDDDCFSRPSGDEHAEWVEQTVTKHETGEWKAATSFALRKGWERASGDGGMNPHTDPLFNASFGSQMSIKSTSSTRGRRSRYERDLQLLVERYDGLFRHFISFPGSPYRLVWDLFGAVLIIYDLIVIPLTQAFEPKQSTFLLMMDWITLVFWTLNMFSSPWVGYVHEGITIMHPGRILTHYLRTWFVVDLVVIVPDWAFTIMEELYGGSAAGGKSVKLLRILRLARTIRLVRLLKLKWILASLNDMLDSEYSSIFVSIIKMILVLLSINHYIACAWFFVAKLNMDSSGTPTWVKFHNFDRDVWLYQYTTSFHWSITQFTPSSMHVQPQNLEERIFAIAVVVFALVGFSYIVGSISGSLAQLRGMQEKGTKEFWNLRRFLRQEKIEPNLALRVQRYLEYAWQKQVDHMQYGQVMLFAYLSDQLHDELKCAMSLPHLVIHPLFEHLRDIGEATLQRLANKAISRKALAGGDSLFFPMETATHMYFIVTGRMEYIRPDYSDEDDGKEHSELVDSREDWICEPVLWTPTWIHLGILKCYQDCDLLRIDAEKFHEVVVRNPAHYSLVCTYARHFIEWINQKAPKNLTVPSGDNCTIAFEERAKQALQHAASPQGITVFDKEGQEFEWYDRESTDLVCVPDIDLFPLVIRSAGNLSDIIQGDADQGLIKTFLEKPGGGGGKRLSRSISSRWFSSYSA